MKRQTLTVIIVCAVVIVAIGALAYYQSLPHSQAGSEEDYWVIYTLTASGNHTQINSRYYNGLNTTDQITWLDFNNKTAVYNYFKCTPTTPGCTVDGCTFSILLNTATEYQVKVWDCGQADQNPADPA
jgi:hypothetical protein